MASLHFIVGGGVAADGDAASPVQSLSLEVEVEGSAPIKSKRELVRASREIAAEEIRRHIGSASVAEFTVTETKAFEKQGQPLAHRDWPGTYVWRVSVHDLAST
jgi:hypothetical protein